MKELIEKLELLKDKLINSEDFEFVGQFEIIQEAIQALSQSVWISVEDRLPNPNQLVLVYGICEKEVSSSDKEYSVGLVEWNVPMASDCKDTDSYSVWYSNIILWKEINLPQPPQTK